MNATTGLATNGIIIKVYKASDNSLVHTSSALSKTAISYTVTDGTLLANTAYYATLTTVSSGGSYCDGVEQGKSSNFTTDCWTVSETLTNTNAGTGASTACPGSNYVTTYTATQGNVLPDNVSVSIGGVAKTQGTHYTWSVSNGTGTLTILAANITTSTGAIAITVSSAAASCTGQYCINSYDTGGNGMTCFTGNSTNRTISDYVIPATNLDDRNEDLWVGYSGAWASHSENWHFRWIPLKELTGGCGMRLGVAPQAVGTLTINSGSSNNNYELTFDPNGYGFVYGSGDSWSNRAFVQQTDPNVWRTAVFALSTTEIGKNYYVGLAKSGGGYVKTLDYDYNDADEHIWGPSLQGTINGMGVANGVNGSNEVTFRGSGLSNEDDGMRGFYEIWSNNCNRNFYCHFVPVHRIIYNANWPVSGAPADTYSADVSVEESSTIANPAAPSAPTGYHFVGWYDAASGGNEVTGTQTISAGATADVTLYAHWSNQTTITLNINGKGTADGSATATYNSDLGATFTGITYSGTRYQLLGYCVNGTSDPIIIDAAGNLQASVPGYTDGSAHWICTEGAVTLKAKWSGAGRTLTWHAGNDSRKSFILDAETITVPGDWASPWNPTSCDVGGTDTYTTFIGWSTEANGTPDAPSASLQGSLVSTGDANPGTDKDYYAVWADGAMSGAYHLVTSASQLSVGAVVTIASVAGNSEDGKVIKAYNSGNNWPSTDASTDATGKIPSSTTDLQSFTLEEGTVDDTWAFYDGTGYIYAANTASGTSNHMKRQDDLDARGSFAISIDGSSYVATVESQGDVNGRKYMRFNSGNNPPIFSCYGSGSQSDIYIYKLVSGATGFISSCCGSAAVVTVTPDDDELELNIDGEATTSVSVSQTGAASGRYYPPTVTPAATGSTDWAGSYKENDYSVNFTATATGTYTIKAPFRESGYSCDKTGSATITVAANPILTPSSDNVAIDATCGTASSATDITVNSRYLSSASITASVTTLTGTGTFKISSDNSTFDTNNKTITGGTNSKEIDHIYVRYDATEGQTGSATGTLTLTCGAKVVNISLSATISCSAHVVLSSASPIQITAANDIWVEASSVVTVTGSYLMTNSGPNSNVSIRAYTDNAHFQIKTGGTTGEGAAKTTQNNALALVTNHSSNDWTGSIGIVYKPGAHNTTESATLTVEVYKAGGSKLYDTKTYTLEGRSLPENFVIAVTDGSGHWFAVPADMVAPWGGSCSSGLSTYSPYPIEVNDASHPTAVTGNTPSRAVYTAAARTDNVNTNPQTLSFKSVAMSGTGNYYLYGSSTSVDSDGSNTSIQNASFASSEKEKWFLDVVNWTNKEYNMHVATSLNTNVLAFTTAGSVRNVGQYAPNAGTTKKAIYILPATSTCDNYIAPQNITCQGIDATNYTIRFKPDRTKNYEISLDGSSWSDVTTSIVNECTDDDHPTLVEAQIPLATYRGQTVYIRVKSAGSCAESTTFTVPDPLLTVNAGTWLTMSGIAGNAFENTENSVTISGLASCASTVNVAVSGTNSDKITASINSSTGVVTIGMTAANAVAGTYNATLTFTADGATTRTQNVTITIRDLADMTFRIDDLSGGKICHNSLSYTDKFYVYLNNGSAVYQANDGSSLVDATYKVGSAVFIRDLSTNGDDWNTGFSNYSVASGIAQFSIPTTSLVSGHTYRISYYNSLANEGAGFFDSNGLGFTDAHEDFVYSLDCTAPTAMMPCITSPTSIVAHWDDFTCEAPNTLQLNLFKHNDTELVNADFPTTTISTYSQAGNNAWGCGKTGVGQNGVLATNTNSGYTFYTSSTSNAFASPKLSTIDASTELQVTFTTKNFASGTRTVQLYVVAGNNWPTTANQKTIYIDDVRTSNKTFSTTSNELETWTVKLRGLAANDRIVFAASTPAGSYGLKSVVISTIARNYVTGYENRNVDGTSLAISGLTANTTYYTTMSCGSKESAEVPFTTWTSGSSYVKFYEDAGHTTEIEALDKIVVLGGQTTHVYMVGQKVPGCEVVPTVSSGYGLEDHTTYDPATGALGGYIDLTLTTPGTTSGTLTITDGAGGTTTRSIKSSDCPTDFETLALAATAITKNGATANWNSSADFEGVTEGTLVLYRDGVVDAEYITNEGFETGDLTGWDLITPGGLYSCGAYSVVNSNYRSGSYSLYVSEEGKNSGHSFCGKSIKVVYANAVTLPAGTYVMTSWVKMPAHQGFSDKKSWYVQGFVGSTLIGSYNETCFKMSDSYTQILTNNTYVELRDTFVLESAIKALPVVGQRYGYDDNSNEITFHKFYLDDVSLKRISAPNAEEPDKVFPITDMSAVSSQDLGTLSGNTQYTYMIKNANGCPSNTITFKTLPADGPTISAEDIEISAPAGSSATGVIVVQVWDATAEISVSKGVAPGSDQITLSNTTVPQEGGTIRVLFTPNTDPGSTGTCPVTLNTRGLAEPVIVNIHWTVTAGEDTNKPIVEVTEVSNEWIKIEHNVDADNVTIILNREKTADEIETNVGDEIFFSKYYEAYSHKKLWAIYNPTDDTISLAGMEVWRSSSKYDGWHSDVMDLSEMGYIKPGWICPNEEIVVYTTNQVGTCEQNTVGLDVMSTWWQGGTSSDMPLSFSGDDALLLVRNTSAVSEERHNALPTTSVKTGEAISWPDPISNARGDWYMLDIIGGRTDGGSPSGKNVQGAWHWYNSKTGEDEDGDDRGWVGYGKDMSGAADYNTSSEHPGYLLSTNRCLLVRLKHVSSGANAVNSNIDNMETLNTEWQGSHVPTEGDQAAVSCNNFSYVGGYDYGGYYNAWTEMGDYEVDGEPNSDGSYTAEFKVNEFYCKTVHIEVSSTEIINGVETQNVHAYEDYKVPIVVDENNLTTATLFSFGGDTCANCDVVIRDEATLRHVSGGVDQFRNMTVYPGASFDNSAKQGFLLDGLLMEAKNDDVGYAIINNNGSTIAAGKVVHVKRIDDQYWYPFSLPYDCDVAAIRQQNGKSMGEYWEDWGIKYYDGAARQAEGESASPGASSKYWKQLPVSSTLKANEAYIIGLFTTEWDGQFKSVYFPPKTTKEYTEAGDDAKTTDVYNWAEGLANEKRHHGWNFVGSPYISLFGSSVEGHGLNNSTNLTLGKLEENGSYTDLGNVYVSIPDGGSSKTYTQARASATKIKPFQGYFIQTVDPDNGIDNTLHLTYQKADRTLTPAPAPAPARKATAEKLRVEVDLVVNGEGMSDIAGVVVDDCYKPEYEIGGDLTKMYAAAKKPQLYFLDASNEKMAYIALPDANAENVVMELYAPKAGQYTISLNAGSSRTKGAESVELLYEGNAVANLLIEDYTIEAAKGTVSGYSVRIRRAAQVATSVDMLNGEHITVISNNGQISVVNVPGDAKVMLFDMTGRLLGVGSAEGGNVVNMDAPQQGVYSVVVQSASGHVSVKTILR
jgi:uncharacterized repeat protein (TIGR02543 family)